MTTTKGVACELRELASDLKAFYSLPGIAEHIMEIADRLDHEAGERNNGREFWLIYSLREGFYDDFVAQEKPHPDDVPPRAEVIHVREVKP